MIVALVALVYAVVWFFVPFVILGLSSKLDRIQKASVASAEYLRQIAERGGRLP